MSLFKPLRAIFNRRPEQRAASSSWTPLGASWGLSGGHVSPAQAESVPTVAAAISAVACGIASLPCLLYRETQDGREEVTRHEFNRLVERGPSDSMTWFELVQFTLRQALAHGNALIEVKTDASGRLIGLVPHPWPNVSMQILHDGRVVFDVTDIVSSYGGTGRQRRLLSHEVLYIRDFTDDGLVGTSRLARAAQVIESALTMQRFQAAFFANGARPSGILEHPGVLGDDATERLRRQWTEMYSGASNVGKTMILEEAMTYKPVASTLEDSELLASRRFLTEEIARVFGVPLPLLNIWDHSSFTNSETASKWFATNTLAPWCKRLESEFSRKLFSEASGLYVEFDMTALLRGNDVERWQCWQIALQNKVLDPSEVRQAEGWNVKAVPVAPSDIPQDGQ